MGVICSHLNLGLAGINILRRLAMKSGYCERDVDELAMCVI